MEDYAAKTRVLANSKWLSSLKRALLNYIHATDHAARFMLFLPWVSKSRHRTAPRFRDLHQRNSKLALHLSKSSSRRRCDITIPRIYTNMASSRIFVKGLPPTTTEKEFRRHFSTTSAVKDAKIYSNRRIGFIGYETAEDAERAVKYFNRTFIRMSKLSVELARPPREAETFATQANGIAVKNHEPGSKRKRENETTEEKDAQLQEFLDVVRPKSRRTQWEQDTSMRPDTASESSKPVEDAEDQSDNEYEEIPRSAERKPPQHVVNDEVVEPASENLESDEVKETEPSENKAIVSDADWARSRTSRLLGLLNDDEEEDQMDTGTSNPPDANPSDDEVEKGQPKRSSSGPAKHAMLTPPADSMEDDVVKDDGEKDQSGVRSSMRLFVRNLPYDVKDEDLEREFEVFGNLEEVSHPRSPFALIS